MWWELLLLFSSFWWFQRKKQELFSSSGPSVPGEEQEPSCRVGSSHVRVGEAEAGLSSSLSAVRGRLHTSHIRSTLFLTHLPMSQAPFQTQKFIFAAFWALIYLRWLCLGLNVIYSNVDSLDDGKKTFILICQLQNDQNLFLVLQTFLTFEERSKLTIKPHGWSECQSEIWDFGLKRQLIKEPFFEFPTLKGPFQLWACWNHCLFCWGPCWLDRLSVCSVTSLSWSLKPNDLKS